MTLSSFDYLINSIKIVIYVDGVPKEIKPQENRVGQLLKGKGTY